MKPLIDPLDYRKLSDAAIELITNGCGPGGWLELLVPDAPFGIDFTPACNRHDYEYFFATCEGDITIANENFKKNLYICVDNAFPDAQDTWRRWGAYLIADIYAEAVDLFGYDVWREYYSSKLAKIRNLEDL